NSLSARGAAITFDYAGPLARLQQEVDQNGVVFGEREGGFLFSLRCVLGVGRARAPGEKSANPRSRRRHAARRKWRPGGVFVNIPNSLTLLRIVLVPFVVWLIITHEMTAAFVLFLLAGLSDAADGYIAKRYGWRSELGAYLDPIADKALLVSI